MVLRSAQDERFARRETSITRRAATLDERERPGEAGIKLQ
jgi:hypothetical protein